MNSIARKHSEKIGVSQCTVRHKKTSSLAIFFPNLYLLLLFHILLFHIKDFLSYRKKVASFYQATHCCSHICQRY